MLQFYKSNYEAALTKLQQAIKDRDFMESECKRARYDRANAFNQIVDLRVDINELHNINETLHIDLQTSRQQLQIVDSALYQSDKTYTELWELTEKILRDHPEIQEEYGHQAIDIFDRGIIARNETGINLIATETISVTDSQETIPEDVATLLAEL